MDPNMMQQGAPQQAPMEAPQPEQMSPEDQLQQQVQEMVAQILEEWKTTGKIMGKRITDEKEARKVAVVMALKQIEEEQATQQNMQAAPEPEMGMGQAPQGGGMMV